MQKFGLLVPYFRNYKKIMLIMKLFTLLIFISLATASAKTSYSQSAKFTLNLERVTVKDLFEKIEKNSEFIFVYYDNIIDLNKEVSVKANNETVDEILEKVFKSSDNTFKIFDRQIVIAKKESSGSDIQTIPTQQPPKKEISGAVKDNKGLPLPGVTVVVKGTTTGTITDNDGKFRLSIDPNSKIIVFSFVGMQPQEITLGTQSNLNITLQEATVGVDEVIIVGYGAQKKESIVGSIAQTSNKELRRSGGVTDLKQALTGNLPGVITITSSGEPGGAGTGQSATSIFIRGQNTWNGGQPLILVDGVERNMDNIDVNEVETISVLKDASATAVFGVKGADGVILITTKRGTVGKPKISFSYNATAMSISRLPEKLDSYATFLKKNEAIEREVVLNEPSWGDYKPLEIVNRYKLPQKAEYVPIYPNVDWQNALFKKVGMSHHANMSVQGGTNFVSYFGSFAYLHEGDMFKKYDNHKGYDPSYAYDRFNFRSNLDFKLTNTTNFRVNLAGFYGLKNTNYSYREEANVNPDIWAAAYGLPPDAYLPQYEDGRWGVASFIPTESISNPVALAYNVGIRENRQTQLNTDFSLDQKLDFITKGLSAKGSFYYDNTIYSQGGLNDVTNTVKPDPGANTPEKYIYAQYYNGPGTDPSLYIQNAPITGVNQFDWVVRPWNIVQEVVIGASSSTAPGVARRLKYSGQLNYARKFGQHNLTAMGMVQREEYATGSEFKHFREDWVSRVTYDYKTKYLFEANGAYNGSEAFGPGYRFGFFPSLAVGWVVSNEKFFKVEWIDRLKFRASTGKVGNDNGGSRWMYANAYSYGGAGQMNQDPVTTTSIYTWFKESKVGNPDVHWETAQKNDFAIETGLFKNLISINADFFNENRTGMLIGVTTPSFFGTTAPTANLGQVKAHGYEIEVKLDKRVGNDFRAWANFSITHTINTVIKKGSPPLYSAYQKAEGYQINQTRSQIRTGFYNNWDQIFASIPQESNDLLKLPGFYDIADFNADGVIKSSDDGVPTRYPETPQNSYNSSLGIDYKGFSLMLQFYGVNNVTRNIPLKDYNIYTDVLFEHVNDSWSKDNPNASSYLPRWKTQNGQFIGDYWLFDGSYLRLKTAELAYTFRDKFIKRAGLSALRIYLNGENLWLWSNLPDDREAALTGGSVADGAYPSVKRVNLGIDITF